MRYNKIKTICSTILVIVLLWLVMSVVDVDLHNDPFKEDFGNYHSWNIFTFF